MSEDNFSFGISLSILNHLGRNLYRSFVTVIGEAISNAWDADAKDVYIYILKKENSFLIKDDGIGMTPEDFQNKFLRIGYSKRKEGNVSPCGRPYIGRKGIGKLALMSCADEITIISKKRGGNYIGGTIDNSGLDKAITSDLTPEEYQLGKADLGIFNDYTKDHEQGTIIYFKNIKEGIVHSSDFLRKIIALYFRFSLIDDKFGITLDDKPVTHKSLDDLASKTQFLWEINDINDPYLRGLKIKTTLKEKRKLPCKNNIKGFIASVEKPRDLKIITTDEKLGIDLFVNGRLRERNILRHIPTSRVVENYLYGQIHFDDLDDDMDRFTSSRESIVADDPKYKDLLYYLNSTIISKVLDDWDKWRRELREDGDSENTSITARERKAEELYNAVARDYIPPEGSKNIKSVNSWIEGLKNDAKHNLSSYADCFISENLVRKYIEEKKIPITSEANEKINIFLKRENGNKINGNINIDIRQNSKLSYLDMTHLANLVDKHLGNQNCLPTDAKEYKPIRDALMHTALLTEEAKTKLKSVFNNIKGRVIKLLS